MASNQDEELQQNNTGAPDHFVVTIGGLPLIPLIPAAHDKDSTPSPRLQLQKTLSRKGSQRGVGSERKDVIAAAADGNVKTFSATTATAGAPEKTQLIVHVVGDQESLSTPTAAAGGGGRWRRPGKRSSSPWIDPRRVMLVFATLSSMGTLILLYFTLSMANVEGGDFDAR